MEAGFSAGTNFSAGLAVAALKAFSAAERVSGGRRVMPDYTRCVMKSAAIVVIGFREYN